MFVCYVLHKKRVVKQDFPMSSKIGKIEKINIHTGQWYMSVYNELLSYVRLFT